MKIELKNTNVNHRMSEETCCFTADVFVNGTKAGTARNRGNGEQTIIYFEDRQLLAECEAWAKTLPAVDSGYGFELDMDLEFYIDQLAWDVYNKKAVA